MAYNTTETLDKLPCTDYVDFGKCQDRFGRFLWSKNDSKYLDIKLKCSREKTKMPNFSQLSQRTKFVSSSSIYTVQRHEGAAEAFSQGD